MVGRNGDIEIKINGKWYSEWPRGPGSDGLQPPDSDLDWLPPEKAAEMRELLSERGAELLSQRAKWYSNGLSPEEAGRLEKRLAKIERPVYGLDYVDRLSLQLHLVYADSIFETDWRLTDGSDIEQLLRRTKARKVSELEGKVVEAYVDASRLRGLSVNESLV